MKNSSENLDVGSLVDIRDVKIPKNLPREERMKSFVEQIKNPYCFKVGSVVVHVSYADNDATLNDRFAEMISVL